MLLAVALPARAEVELPLGDDSHSITIRGNSATQWTQGSYEVWHVRGACEIRQGEVVARAPEGLFWIDRAESFSGVASKVIAYLEGSASDKVLVDFGRRGNPHAVSRRAAQSLEDRSWVGRFQTFGGIQLTVPLTGKVADEGVRPAIFDRGSEASFAVQQASGQSAAIAADPARRYPLAQVAQAPFGAEEIAPPTAAPVRPASSRVRFQPRGSGGWNGKYFRDPATGQQMFLATGGVQAIIDGLDELGNVSIEADNVFGWLPTIDPANPNVPDPRTSEVPYEIYLEGNIVFRQGDRVIYADRMYYNVTQEYGVVLSAEMLTPVKDYQGLLRLRAEVLQQIDRQHFQAYGAALTSSRIGVPRYWFQAENVQVEDIQRPIVDPFSGQPLVNPATGEMEIDHQLMAQSRNNFVFLAEVPVFYWPVIATDLTKPTYYLDRIRIKSDRVFGQQLLLDWDAYQLFGIRNRPRNTRFTLSTDLLSERGFGVGSDFRYEGETLWGLAGPFRGFLDAWGLIHEEGVDNLGFDRRAVPPEETFRGRVLGHHRHYLPENWTFTGEFGLISDRNFLEQYYETEWDALKDQTTGIELKKLTENRSLSLTADARLNDFFTQTEWLPRVDHFTFGQSLWFDRLSWHEHSHIGYGRLQPANPPTNPVDLAKFSPLLWEADVEGVRAATRQQLDLPLEIGPVKIVPYLLGEAAYWGSDLSADEVTRLYGQTGVKSSLPLWTADPSIQSALFNLNGLAHKVVLDAEFLYADADEDLSRFPLYDQLDDDAQEAFRRRMAVNTFGLPVGSSVPLKYDERFYALRSNLQGLVTGPTEIADDLMELRTGLRQRWQTKRGLPGQERIIDWITLDTDVVFFPKPGRDNFGADLGLVDYDFAWHVGDRLTLLSDGFYDFFDQGLRQVTIGSILSRPEYGSLYVGFRSTEGPISANVFNASVSYRMSEKWIATGGTSIDFSSSGNIGQNIALTRIGESFLVRLGFILDNSRNNVGLQFTIEPRFLPHSRLGRVGGVQIPPAGARGLE